MVCYSATKSNTALAGILLLSAAAVDAATAAQWRSRSVYQLITDRFAQTDESTTASCNQQNGLYCGGTWRGIIKKLDYIQGMGFSAVYISPVTGQVEGATGVGEAYMGFWQQDLYSVNGHFGTADDLKALSQALHDRDMYLMTDMVVNHFAWPGSYGSIEWSQFTPFNQQSYFHDYCMVDFSNGDSDNLQKCYQGNDNLLLVDVRTEDDDVRNTYNTWVKDLVTTYSIDGFRIDTAKHVEPSFFDNFEQSAGVYTVGEVFDGETDLVCSYQEHMSGVLNYPVWYLITQFLQGTASSAQLVNRITELKNGCKDVTLLGSFGENFDNPRFPNTTSDMSLAKNLLAFTLLSDGIPIIYSGQEQHYAGGTSDQFNREPIWLSNYNTDSELYKHIASLNAVRNNAIFADSTYVIYNNWAIYSDDDHVAMRKGYDNKQIVTVINNRGENSGSYTLSLPNHGWQAGVQVVDVLSCLTATVDGTGYIQLPMESGLPRVLYPVSVATGSGICGL